MCIQSTHAAYDARGAYQRGKEGFATMPEVVVIDCAGHMLGRLASIIAKQLLNGQKIVAVRCEKISLSGGFVRQKMKYERFRRKRHLTQPAKGPYHFKAPSKILWRTIRGMVPHKTKRGAFAMNRFQAFEGVPAPYDKVKRVVIPDALKVLRIQQGHKVCSLGELSTAVGWKYGEVVEELEAKRKESSKSFWEAKKSDLLLMKKAAA